MTGRASDRQIGETEEGRSLRQDVRVPQEYAQAEQAPGRQVGQALPAAAQAKVEASEGAYPSAQRPTLIPHRISCRGKESFRTAAALGNLLQPRRRAASHECQEGWGEGGSRVETTGGFGKRGGGCGGRCIAVQQTHIHLSMQRRRCVVCHTLSKKIV